MTDGIQKGDHAKRLLEDPLLTEALDNIEEATINMWKDTVDSKARNELWFTLKGLERFKTQLQSLIEDGVYDKHNKGNNV